MNIGEKVPDLAFKATNGLESNLADYRGSWMVIYFYPKDATPGCTLEGCQFRDQAEAFSLKKTVIFGVSRDSLASHEKFKTNRKFPFELISDPDEALCQLFDVIKAKSLFGIHYKGIERSTFIIDDQGILRHAFRKVKVKNHVQEVMKELERLQKSE